MVLSPVVDSAGELCVAVGRDRSGGRVDNMEPPVSLTGADIADHRALLPDELVSDVVDEHLDRAATWRRGGRVSGRKGQRTGDAGADRSRAEQEPAPVGCRHGCSSPNSSRSFRLDATV